MPTVGNDCEVIIDGTGYFIKPGSYHIKHPRVRHSQYRADMTLSYVDQGVGKRTWSMTILCLNELKKFDGTVISTTGQSFRDALKTSYTGSTGTTIIYYDPVSASSIAVHFDKYTEHIPNMRSRIIAVSTGGSAAASYEVEIELVEA